MSKYITTPLLTIAKIVTKHSISKQGINPLFYHCRSSALLHHTEKLPKFLLPTLFQSNNNKLKYKYNNYNNYRFLTNSFHLQVHSLLPMTPSLPTMAISTSISGEGEAKDSAPTSASGGSSSLLSYLRTNRAEYIASSSTLTPSIAIDLKSRNASFDSSLYDIIVIFLTSAQSNMNYLSSHPTLKSLLPDLTISPHLFNDFTGKNKQTTILYTSTLRVLLVGLGKAETLNNSNLRSGVHTAISNMKSKKLTRALFFLPDILTPTLSATSKVGGTGSVAHLLDTTVSVDQIISIISRIAPLSNHTFQKYITKTEQHTTPVQSLTIVLPDTPTPQQEEIVRDGVTVSDCVILARELSNTRADDCNPAYMESIAKTIATTHGLSFTVLHDDELRARGYNLITSVGQGAREKARIVEIEYKGDIEGKDTIALVGKGITFDTGGLNLKATGMMETMYMDMSGSAIVLSTIKALALLSPRINVTAVLALAENAIDGLSYKPHNIIPTSKGTVEISNTDAEGRLAMADAFTYIQSKEGITTLIDVATLTGAIVIALGEICAGLFSNNDLLSTQLTSAGHSTAERFWRMPMFPEYSSALDNSYADMTSTGGRYGSSCIAASFLQKFVNEGVQWAHLDVAGPAMYSVEREYMCKGGTGFGVQTLVQFIMEQDKAKKMGKDKIAESTT